VTAPLVARVRNHRLHGHRYWNIGIEIGGLMQVLMLRVLG
jgi:hypothetical protein